MPAEPESALSAEPACACDSVTAAAEPSDDLDGNWSLLDWVCFAPKRDACELVAASEVGPAVAPASAGPTAHPSAEAGATAEGWAVSLVGVTCGAA